MSVKPSGISTRVEELFLGVLRAVILVVLAVALLGTLGFLFVGVSNFRATPGEFQPRKFDASSTIKSIKDEQKKGESPTRPEHGSTRGATTPRSDPELEKLVDEQLKIWNQFLERWSTGFVNPQAKKAEWIREARAFARPDTAEGAREYARGHVEFLKVALNDPEVIRIADEARRSGDSFGSFCGELLTAYPDYWRDVIADEAKFKAAETARVAELRASSVQQLYIAGSAFVVFLSVALLLVQVKIERNLRLLAQGSPPPQGP